MVTYKVDQKKIHSEKLLVKQLISGNEKAFAKLFDIYRSPIYGYSLTLIKSKDHAEEIVQEVFIKIWLIRESLDLSKSFRSLLFTMARNMIFNVLKKAANDIRLQEELFLNAPESHNPTDRIMREADLNRIKQEAIDRLPPKRKLIFEMSRNDGKTYEDISQELGISTSTVKTQMSLALETLRTFLLHNKDITLTIALLTSGWIK